jgi:uncharacterized membrane protein YphA (DoxX/SURF4 family)
MSADLRPARAGLVGKVYDFWCRPIRAEPLALFRILLGLSILGSLATGIGPRLATCCGPDALCPASAQDDWLRRGGRICLLRGPVGLPLLDGWLSAEQAQAWARWGERPASAYLLFALYVLALLCLTAGFWTRLSALAAALLAATFYHRLSDLTNGGDALARNGLYFLLFAPAGAAWSVDSWLRRRKQARRARGLPAPAPRGPVLIPPWSVRLMQIQLCLVYLGTGLAKLNDLHLVNGWRPAGDWVSGEAMYWVLNDVSLSRWPYAVLPVPLFVCRLMSWATLLFEIGFTFLVPFRRLRRWVLLAGVGFHLGILAVLEVGWFTPIALSWYALFIPGEPLARWSARLAGSFPGAAPGTAPEPRPSPEVAPAPAV